MTSFDRFDLVVAPFPFVDAPRRKPRPILVITNREFIDEHRHFVGAMITTAAASSWNSDLKLTDLTPTGLDHPSVVRFKLFTLPVAVVSRRLGALSTPDATLVSRAILRHLGA